MGIKCKYCNSCLVYATVENRLYLFCSLDWKLYVKRFDGLIEVMENKDYIISEIQKQIGTTIIL